MIMFLSFLPIIQFMIYYLYTKSTGGYIDMDGTVVAAIISGAVALVGIFVTLLRYNKQDKGRFELLEKDNETLKTEIEECHTLSKAKEYHKLTMREFDSNRERILDAKEEIKDISSSVSGISTDIQLMSKDIENHILNLKEVRIQEPNLIQALKIFEGYIQELGKAERQIQTLENEKGQLISQYEKEICKLKLQINSLEKDNHELHEQNEKLLSKYKDVIENDDFGLEI